MRAVVDDSVAVRSHPGKDSTTNIPKTRWAKTIDGAYVAYQDFGEGECRRSERVSIRP
jgi:hypothetical protein